jgi:hypothetical protein
MYGVYKVDKRVSPTINITNTAPSIEEISAEDKTGKSSMLDTLSTSTSGYSVRITGFTGFTTGNRLASRYTFAIADAEL